MADYNVTSSDGSFIVTVQTGTINSNYDIPFLGQDSINYGDDLVTAQLRQLENFANITEPAFGTTRVKGQLWYDSTPITGRLNVFDGSAFDTIPLDIDVVHATGAENIAGIKTFDDRPVFASAGAPMTINSNTEVANLNADLLDGQHGTAFATAAQGALADGAQINLPINTTPGYVLSADATSPQNLYTWVSLAVSAGQVATDPTSTLDTTTNVLLVGDEAATTGGTVQDPLYATGLTYNAATSNLSTTTFTGTLSGNATSATSATTAGTATNATNITVDSNDGNSSDTTTYPVLVAANSATNQLPHVDGSQLSYNASTGQLNAAIFAGSGASLTAINMTTGPGAGTLAVARGGTGVTNSTGAGGNFVLSSQPTFLIDLTTPIVTNATSVAIQYNTTTELITQLHTTTGQTTGAQVRHHDTNLYDVGLNVLPSFNFDASDTLEAQHCGMLTGKTDASAYTLTIPAASNLDFPIGGVATIANLGTVLSYTVADAADATLFYVEPGIGATDVAGSCTIGIGGVATLYRLDAGNYYIWGSEITP